MSSATTVQECEALVESGFVDVVIAQGFEAGGHRGMFLFAGEKMKDESGRESMKIAQRNVASQQGLFALLPQIVQVVRRYNNQHPNGRQVKVLAAGGIVSGASVAAAMALGADGVQAGTVFLLCDEAKTSTLHRKAIQRGVDDGGKHETALTNLLSGRPARSIMNDFMAAVGPYHVDALPFPHAANMISLLRSAAESSSSSELSGSTGLPRQSEFTSLWCGSNVSGCRSVPAAAQVRRIVEEYEAIIENTKSKL